MQDRELLWMPVFAFGLSLLALLALIGVPAHAFDENANQVAQYAFMTVGYFAVYSIAICFNAALQLKR